MKNITKLRMIIPTVNEWIESNKIVIADIYKSRQLLKSFEINKITITDTLELSEKENNKICYIDLNSIKRIGIVNGVCNIKYNDFDIMISKAA